MDQFCIILCKYLSFLSYPGKFGILTTKKKGGVKAAPWLRYCQVVSENSITREIKTLEKSTPSFLPSFQDVLPIVLRKPTSNFVSGPHFSVPCQMVFPALTDNRKSTSA